MSFKVLNADWEIVTVKQIRWDIHRHNSWREFSEEEISKLNGRSNEAVFEATNSPTEKQSLEALREQYEEDHWKKVPNNKKNDPEWIESKLK